MKSTDTELVKLTQKVQTFGRTYHRGTILEVVSRSGESVTLREPGREQIAICDLRYGWKLKEKRG